MDGEGCNSVTPWWAWWYLKSPVSRLFVQPYVQAQINEIQAPRHWPLWGESTGHRWIPLIKGPVKRKIFPFDDVHHGDTFDWSYVSNVAREYSLLMIIIPILWDIYFNVPITVMAHFPGANVWNTIHHHTKCINNIHFNWLSHNHINELNWCPVFAAGF